MDECKESSEEENNFSCVVSVGNTGGPPTTPTTDTLPGAVSTLLPSSVLVEIFSYIVSDYSDLAKLRLISKQFNQNCIPFITTSQSCAINCLSRVHREHSTAFAGDIYYKLPCYDTMDTKMEFRGSRHEGFHDRYSPPWAFCASKEGNICFKLDSILAVSPVEEGRNSNRTPNIITKSYDEESSLKSICHQLLETRSLKEFLSLSKEAEEAGLFAPQECPSYETKINSDNEYALWTTIVTVSTIDGENNDSIYGQYHQNDIINLELIGQEFYTYGGPKNRRSNQKSLSPQKSDIGQSFRGFVKDGKVLIPMMLFLDRHDFNAYYCTENLQVYEILDKYQYSINFPEGISIVDGAIPKALHGTLMQQIDELANTQDADYHPHSNNIVRDLVHPALYAYVKGQSIVDETSDKIPPCVFKEKKVVVKKKVGHGSGRGKGGKGIGCRPLSTPPVSNRDYWGRPYEASLKYQYLPTYFDINADGACTICDYINNLVPRQQYSGLYSSLEQLFAYALPQLESVYWYGRVVKPDLRVYEHRSDSSERHFDPLKPKYCSFKNQKLQVVTKIVDYELGPGDEYEGVWHVEGMSHEEIVATAIYFLHRDEDIKGGNILFKRSFYISEAQDFYECLGQEKSNLQDKMVQDSFLPLGQVETLANRLLVFPNSHVHKVRKMQRTASPEPSAKKVRTNETKSNSARPTTRGERVSSDDKKVRRIVVFFLINPEKRIVSTREVKPQQVAMGGNMSHEEALNHRLELMKERKYSKQDWNVREVNLCEH